MPLSESKEIDINSKRKEQEKTGVIDVRQTELRSQVHQHTRRSTTVQAQAGPCWLTPVLTSGLLGCRRATCS